jgi:hypothetical protein
VGRALHENASRFAIEGGGDFWIGEGEPPAAPVHVAFAAADRATVDKFHRAAVEAGGRDNGAPGLRPHYHAEYYAAFVIDPDGTTSKRSSTETASYQPRDARLPQRAGMTPDGEAASKPNGALVPPAPFPSLGAPPAQWHRRASWSRDLGID